MRRERAWSKPTPMVTQRSWRLLFRVIYQSRWLLTEGGSSLSEKNTDGAFALKLAACAGRFATVQWLLEEGGASISERDDMDRTVWNGLLLARVSYSTELFSLLKFMVMLEDAPSHYVNSPRLSLQHAELCTRGRQLRAQLPSYLEQQRAAVVAHCPLPAKLLPLVAAYVATTPEDMWTDGLRVEN